MIGAIAAVLALIVAVIALFRKKSAPRQTSGDRGVNISGDNSAPINTGSQTTREK